MKRFLSILFFASACSNQANELLSNYEPDPDLVARINQEIKSISNSAELQEYLKTIGQLDQHYRNEETNILQRFGQDSKEHQKIRKKIIQTDAENYFKIDALLAEFGYPDADSVGLHAASIPYMVIHHSPFYEYRTKHFKLIYKAYSNGDLTDNSFNLFLDRMYHIKFNESFEMSSPYRMEQKIDTLIRVLELEELING